MAATSRYTLSVTLVITILGNNKVVQVADTRLTLNGKLHDAHAIKAVGVACADAQFCIGYSGVAEIEGQRTDYWLVDQVASIFASGRHGIRAVTWELAVRAEHAMPKLRYQGMRVKREGRALQLVMAGYHHSEIGPLSRPFVTSIMNTRFQGIDEPLAVDDDFVIDASMLRPGLPNSETGGRILGIAAATMLGEDPYARQARKTLNQVMRDLKRIDLGERPSGRATVERLVEVIRQASRHPRHGHLIGRDCLSIVMHPNNRMPFVYYHPEAASSTIRLPHLVTPWQQLVDAELHEADG
jgi:hypothetical protein